MRSARSKTRACRSFRRARGADRPLFPSLQQVDHFLLRMHVELRVDVLGVRAHRVPRISATTAQHSKASGLRDQATPRCPRRALPAPMARITVAAPMTASPPANTPRLRRRARARSSAPNRAARRHFQPQRGFRDQQVGLQARRNRQHVDVDDELAASTAVGRRRPLTSGSPSSMRTHSTPDIAFSSPRMRVGFVSNWETDALLLRHGYFLGARRHLLAAAAVHHGHLGAQAPRRARRPWPHVACRPHHAFLPAYRRLVLGEQVRLLGSRGSTAPCHRHAVEASPSTPR